MNLNERIKHFRKEARLSQEDVAEALGVSRQAVSKWETAQSFPDTQNLLKLAELFHVSVSNLADLTPEEQCQVKRRSPSAVIVGIISIAGVIVGVLILVLIWSRVNAPAAGPVSSSPAAVSGVVSSPPEAPVSVNVSASSISPQQSSDTTLNVYLAFVTLSKSTVTEADNYMCRKTIYQGLCALNWDLYSSYGEAGKNSDTRLALLEWLSRQNTLSEEELRGLLAGMNKGIDGAFCEPYALALRNALLSYPVQFVKGLTALPDATYAKQVADMTIYGAGSKTLAAKAAIDSATYSGELSDSEAYWAVYLNNRCENLMTR